MTAAYPVEELSEWQTKELPGLVLSAEDRKLVRQLADCRRVMIDELRSGVRIQSRSWVGVVHLSGFELRIMPKLAGDNLNAVEMLAFDSGLDALRRSVGRQQLQPEAGGHLLDLFALLLAQACERIVNDGLLYDYVEVESDLPVLRGRLLADRQLRRRLGRIDRLECRYDDRSSDVLENQILTAALAACKTRVSHPATSLRVRRLHGLFSAACSLAEFDLGSARDGLGYNRLNEHYREAHDLAWLVLEGLGITDLFVSGPTRSFAFLLDMNQLFERFVFRLVERILRGRPYRVRYQYRDRSILWDVTHTRPYTGVIPDLLIEAFPAGHRRLAVDAKYKTYDEARLSTGDIYQSFLYAYAYGGQGVLLPEAVLLYPASQAGVASVQLEVRGAAQQAGARIQAVGIRIPQALDEVRSGTLGTVTRFLLEVFDRSLVTLPASEGLS